MRRYLTDDPLEDFLKQNADRFQIRPSDKVWQGISDNLKSRNRRAIWFTGFFVAATSIAGYLLVQQAPQTGTLASLQIRALHFSGIGADGTATNSELTSGHQSLAGIDAAGSPAAGASDRFTFDNNINRNNSNRRNTGSGLTAGSSSRPHSATRSADAAGGVDETTPSAFVTGFESDEPSMDITDASLAAPVTKNTPDLANAPQTADSKLAQPKAKGARVSLQFFFTPTVSYRALSENKDYSSDPNQNVAGPYYPSFQNINDAVTHKPGIGLEVGLTAKYALYRNLKIQGGVQFNMSRYEMQAFENNVPQTATVAYNGGGTASRTTNYSNVPDGGRKDWLQNMYFQVSAPIGVELKLAGNGRTQFGIASTIQPTYLLTDQVYTISTDYKNYAEVPGLVRRFNVNTALSTYVGYSTGKINWQVGPQVRYQLFSSYINKYPVKEHLFDFGLRVGVSLNKGAH